MNQLEPLQYDLIAPQKIVFGWGRRREVGTLAAALGRRAFIVEGSRTLAANGTLSEIFDLLVSAGMQVVPLAMISREPEVIDVDTAVGRLRDHGAGPGDVVIAIGGGSAIDLAKAATALATNRDGESANDYLEGVGRGCTIVAPPLPLVALPTTGGTGTEATKNAVISSFEPPFKKSLRSELMVPRMVLVDPELSVSVPSATTAWTGMDAITQLVESYICRSARPIPQALAVDGLRRAVPAIVEAVRDGTSRPARESMAHAALLSGMALANSGLGLAHGVAAALGVHSRVAHGLACAVMLPVALRVNRHVRQRELAVLAHAVLEGTWASDALAADAFIEKIGQLSDAVGVPRRLREIGVRREQIPAIVGGSRGNSMNGNPREVPDEELTILLEEML